MARSLSREASLVGAIVLPAWTKSRGGGSTTAKLTPVSHGARRSSSTGAEKARRLSTKRPAAALLM